MNAAQNVNSELENYLKEMQDFTPDTANDPADVRDYIIRLTSILARSNYLMALLQRRNRESKKNAYLSFFGSELQNKARLNKVNAKDFIDNVCSNTAYSYELAERCSRAAYHVIEAFRSVLSSLKAEQQFSHLP